MISCVQLRDAIEMLAGGAFDTSLADDLRPTWDAA